MDSEDKLVQVEVERKDPHPSDDGSVASISSGSEIAAPEITIDNTNNPTKMSLPRDKSFWLLAFLFGALHACLLLHMNSKYNEYTVAISDARAILTKQAETLRPETLSKLIDASDFTSSLEQGAPPTVTPLSGYISNVVDSYNTLVEDNVRAQTESWMFLPEYEGVDEASMDSCPRVSPKIRSVPPTLPVDKMNPFDWDDETDIPKYLDDLYVGCSGSASDDPQFNQKCWKVMKDLVYKPRCTTRFDSRVTCQSGQQPDMLSVSTSNIETILDGHYSNDTLNIVIVGGGPTGLFLANSLAEANRLDSSVMGQPEIRVTVIESRVEAPGVKEGFIRNWQTIPSVEDVVEPIDPRLGKIFASLTNRNFFLLPLNVIETLLLLSSRDLGVKFLYGNVTDYTQYLSQQPNLIVFDSTGHRLDGLVRGTNCPQPDRVPGIQSGTIGAHEVVRPWKPDADKQDWYYVQQYHYEILNKFNFIGNIAQKGDIVYPLSKDGLPYATWWLHVHEIPYPEEEYERYFFEYRSRNTAFCKVCRSKDYQLLESWHRQDSCKKFCKPNNFFDGGIFFRKDMVDAMERDDGFWFATRGANVHISAQQAMRLLEIIDELGYTKDPVGIPMNLLPLDDMAEEEIFEDSLLLDGLRTLAYVDEGDEPPIISIFQQRPYIYANGEIKGDLFGSKTPFLRIGDSLCTGDPNRSSGFVNHVWFVRNLVCKLRGKESDCSKHSRGNTF